MIDLHTHSTESDGSLTPSELIDLAAASKVELIALADHDTVEGVPEFLAAAARKQGVQAIGAVEISTVQGGHHAHVLGYGVTQPSSEFARMLEDFRQSRDRRGEAIIERLRELGVDITLGEARAQACGAVFGRPHIAAVMIAKGIVRDTTEAFRRYLGLGAKAYVERNRPTTTEAVRILREERLVPVLAHPITAGMPEEELDRFIATLRANGLMGIEGYYPTYSRSDTDLLQRTAARHGLLRTGGSDFHGDAKPSIALGTGTGNLNLPVRLGQKLLSAIKDVQASG